MNICSLLLRTPCSFRFQSVTNEGGIMMCYFHIRHCACRKVAEIKGIVRLVLVVSFRKKVMQHVEAL